MPSALAEEWKPCAESRFLSEMAAPPTGRCSPALTASRTTPSGALDGVVREAVNAGEQRPVGGAAISLRNLDSAQGFHSSASAEGIFRLFPLPPGRYELRVESEGYAALVWAEMALGENEVVTLEFSLVQIASGAPRSRRPRLPELGPPVPGGAPERRGTPRELRHRLDADPSYVENPPPESLPPAADVYNVMADRWNIPVPEYRRYAQKGEYVYVHSHWYDPFNRNKWKGDYPIWRSEEHTSELQSLAYLVCRLLLEKKK